MTELELATVDDLVRRYAAELVPQASETRFADHILAFLIACTAAILVLGSLKLNGAPVLMVLGAFSGAGAAGAELVARRRHRAELGRFKRELGSSPWRLYEAVAGKFADEIERHRARTLGPDSDWSRARKPLDAAAQETARSVAYWEQRCAMDRGNEFARQQLETAQRLRDKFQDALTQLDARAQVLVTFFNECDARLAVLQHAKRDYEEVKKLGALSERADAIVTDAQRTLSTIGSTFLSEAIRVANALGGIERVGWLSLADSVSVERIETLADRILESSAHERGMLERLTRQVLG